VGLVVNHITGAAPVSVEDIGVHLRVDTSDEAEAAYLAALIDAATEFVETRISKQIRRAELTYTLDGFPPCRAIDLPWPPLVSVESVRYIDADDAEQPLDPSAYSVDVSSLPGRIVRGAVSSWPSTSRVPNAVSIAFTAGYPDDAVPPTLAHLIRLIVGHWHEHREGATDGTITEVPLAVAPLIESNRYAGVF